MESKQNLTERFTVGEFIQDELEARGWADTELAARTGLSPEEVRQIIGGSRRILARDAEAIGQLRLLIAR